MVKVIISSLVLGGLGFAFHRYQDRLPEWARRPAKKPVKKTAIQQQPHLQKHLQQLEGGDHDKLANDIQSLDMEHIRHIFSKSKEASEASTSAHITPLQPGDVKCIDDVSDGEEMRWIRTGFRLIAEGKLGVILLAGGQGTRLGSSAPKGCYDIGLPSRKSLFQLFAERIARVQKLAADGVPSDIDRKPVRWYIMTSTATDQETKVFFRQRSYFGLTESQVVFFQQGTLPCLTESGDVILETASSVARAPDGNGGLYAALQREGVLHDMAKHGVECLDCVSVDNALVRMADPLFAGFCHEQNAQCGARVLSKAHPEERVGVFARKNGKVEVVEYSELDPSEAAATFDIEGKGGGAKNDRQMTRSWSLFKRQSKAQLKYNWSNVCMHYFTRDFLELAADHVRVQGVYHVAKKKIPSKDGPVQGIKLELFIFDTFPLAERVALLEVHRHEEFAPVKNAPGSKSDSPDTARQAMLKLHTRLVSRAGGRVRLPKGCKGLEISPLVSYSGEGLRALCRGRTFRQAHDVFLQGLVPDKALSRELTQARREDVRTPGTTPLTTPGRTPPGSPRGSAPSTPFRKIPE
ncbi:hypothetical protein CVIRNUC_011162 [Coccomyxa viridis]|uniref:UDP-N-acetylglucosamine diphosphorylase n=1 Tax=Coccomyxa viridis TaxID=1274662 RepID=A0AAV1IP57_9CHLO|nr:hypothetical protein CVIRNUC_011162 [Coccomyxa viridis]